MGCLGALHSDFRSRGSRFLTCELHRSNLHGSTGNRAPASGDGTWVGAHCAEKLLSMAMGEAGAGGSLALDCKTARLRDCETARRRDELDCLTNIIYHPITIHFNPSHFDTSYFAPYAVLPAIRFTTCPLCLSFTPRLSGVRGGEIAPDRGAEVSPDFQTRFAAKFFADFRPLLVDVGCALWPASPGQKQIQLPKAGQNRAFLTRRAQ